MSSSVVNRTRWTKTAARLLVALFAAFFGTIQLSITVCQGAPETAWTYGLCHSHRVASLLLSFVLLFALTLLILSRRAATFRQPLAVLLLSVYGIYGLVDAFETRLWWIGLVPAAALIAAIGVALRTRWGTLVTYAISALFVIYWCWGVIAGLRAGVFQSQPPSVAALMLVPGIAFALLAGFCCYACRTRAASTL